MIERRGRVLTPGEVAELFGVDPKTVGRWATAGVMPYFTTPGGHHRFWETDVMLLLDRDRHVEHPLVKLAQRIVALDDPVGPGMTERRTVSLNQIIGWARSALSETGIVRNK